MKKYFYIFLIAGSFLMLRPVLAADSVSSVNQLASTEYNQVQNQDDAELKFIKVLRKGSKGDNVEALQNFLSQHPDVYPEGTISGYFGIQTERAVKKFQEKYGIASTGTVGPKTLVKLNELILFGDDDTKASSSETSVVQANQNKIIDNTATTPSIIISNNPNTTEKESCPVKSVENVRITAYSTGGSPLVSPALTASETLARYGVVAANWLPFGTKIRIPEMYGDKIFTVEDKMNRRFNLENTKGIRYLDVWFLSQEDAIVFGSKKNRIEIL